MASGLPGVSLLFIAVGAVITFVGYRVWTDERTELVFAPGIDAPEAEIAKGSGQVTVLAGIATVGLGVGTAFVVPNAAGWLLLLVPYTVVCLAGALWMRWRLSR